MNENELYSIGDVARRTGLSVSAVRYYSDAGIVTPTEQTPAGYRHYDVQAIARLEFVRTLRELDAGLDDIRRVLAGETTLHDLAAAHLAVVEEQTRRFHARRAVLRSILRQDTPDGQVVLMHRLVSMSDEDRERLLDEFWAEVSEGLDVNPAMIDRLSQTRAVLPDDPTPEQLEAWIELADLVRDEDFRAAVRSHLREEYSTEAGRIMSSSSMLDSIDEGTPIMAEAMEARRAGIPVDSSRARDIADRYSAWLSGVCGKPDCPEFRQQSAKQLRIALELHGTRNAEADPHWESPFTGPHDRYLDLVATINGHPTSDELVGMMADQVPYAWLADALRASASSSEPGTAA
ncbi:MerR family transcriptional regulator [Actinoalloteichus caeruleus]|uniref:MerR family transcriptional regulator n=1 Tax=Actinoalloteichus cyanogriseus TaxID=2893586 RepID=UPI00047C5D57|nr:MerR family transcriptional regulator [Actinoalloteichus caeruleus]